MAPLIPESPGVGSSDDPIRGPHPRRRRDTGRPMRAFILVLVFALAVGCGAMRRTTIRVSQAHLTGDRITLDDHINFEHDSAVIVAESDALIQDIADVLSAHTELATVHVVGHTDSTGDDAHNLDLTERRAASVRRALNERNVLPSRLRSRGYGETVPICREHNENCWSQNRRVEFIILKRSDEAKLQGGEGQ